MATYSKEFKDKLIKLMLPPENKPVKELADEYNVHQQTLYKWRKSAKSKGTIYPDNRSSKQKYSKEIQLQIIIETSPLNNHELSEYCRRKAYMPKKSSPGKNLSSMVKRMKSPRSNKNSGTVKQNSSLLRKNWT